MERWTRTGPEGTAILTKGIALREDGAIEGPAVERLAWFEEFYLELAARQKTLKEALGALKAEGREKSWKFRETLGEKLLTDTMMQRMKDQGLT